ncbi:MAG: hypothetical protein ACOYJK_02935 [Prevotella sp.]|jgi:hypothetical protein
MKRRKTSKKVSRQHRNMQYSEDRFELLDTIRELVSDELEHRRAPLGDTPDAACRPPEDTGREPPVQHPSHRTLWQRIVSLFTGTLL